MTKNVYMNKIGERAKIAALNLSNININKRNSVLKQFSQYLKINTRAILNSNVKDISAARRKKNKETRLIKTVKEIDENIKRYATRTENLYGSGGMKTKIEAAKICQLSGSYMVIANGNHKNPIKKII